MGINPFSGDFTFTDEEGTWYGCRSHERDCYILVNTHTGDRKEVPCEEIDRHRRSSHYGGYLYTPTIRKRKPGEIRADLVACRWNRWRKKVVRMQDKKWERRKMFLADVGWKIGLLWGGVGTVVLSIYLIKWLLFLVLG